MARKIIPQEFSAGNGTGNRTRNYLDGPKNNSPIIFGRRVIVLTTTVVARAIRNAIHANRFPRIIRNCDPYFYIKNLLMPLFLMGCFPGDFQERKRPIKEEKRPLRRGNAPLTLMGSFRALRHAGKRPL